MLLLLFLPFLYVIVFPQAYQYIYICLVIVGFMLLCKCLIDNLSSKLDQVKSSLVVTKTVNGHFLNWITSLKSRGNITYALCVIRTHCYKKLTFLTSRCIHVRRSRIDCLKVVGISTSVDDKNLQLTVCNVLNKTDVLVVQKFVKIAIRSKVTSPSSNLIAK